jgi:hypothetical protein
MAIVARRSRWLTRSRLSCSKSLFINMTMLSSSRTPISTPITLLGDTTYKYASRFHLIPSAGADLEANLSQPGSARAEAERRRFVVSSLSGYRQIISFSRAMALKALDQRLANPANTPPPAQPSRPSPQATSTKPETTKTPDESEGGDLGTSGQTSR